MLETFTNFRSPHIFQVVAADKTDMMMDMMKMELEKFERIKDTFVQDFTPADFEDIHQVKRIHPELEYSDES